MLDKMKRQMPPLSTTRILGAALKKHGKGECNNIFQQLQEVDIWEDFFPLTNLYVILGVIWM